MAGEAGYPEACGVGMLSAGYLGTDCVDVHGTRTVRRFRTRSRELVWRGRELLATGTIKCVPTGVASRTVEVGFALENLPGKAVVEGNAEFEFPLGGPSLTMAVRPGSK
jgi:hypothetical protein